jgi:hypothetical protein
MNKIIFPLEPDIQGAAVADLQEALRLLLNSGRLQIADEERLRAEERLRSERAAAHFGAATRDLVAAFQEQHRIERSGLVDERTAALLNAELESIGAFRPDPTPRPLRDAYREALIEKVVPILQTSRTLRGDAAFERFTALLAAETDVEPRSWDRIASEAELSDEQIGEVKLTLEFGTLTRHDVPLVGELQSLRHSGRIRSGRDLVDLSTDEWKTPIRRAFARRREGPSEPSDSQIAAAAADIQARLRKAYPTRYVAKALASPPSFDLPMLRRVMAANPDLDPAMPLAMGFLHDFGPIQAGDDSLRQRRFNGIAAGRQAAPTPFGLSLNTSTSRCGGSARRQEHSRNDLDHLSTAE